MADKQPSRADRLREMREAKYEANHSRGSGSSTAGATGGVQRRKGSDDSGERPSNSKGSVPNSKANTSEPREAKPTKKKRAPNGTFDRNAYQRELMRQRRQKESKGGAAKPK